MPNFQVIEGHSKEWNEILKRSHSYDFYHTEFYHNLETDGTPIMLVATVKENFIGLPLIIRRIEGTQYSDATSVYGYAGPIASQPIKNLDDDLLVFFKTQAKDYLQQRNIISVFSRLHPLIDQSKLFKDFGKIVELNKTVSIDLTLPLEEQRRIFRKSLKSELNQLRRLGFLIEEAKDKGEIDSFVDIYHATMDKLGASDDYYFSREYFHSFLDNKDFECKLLLSKFEGKITAGAIFTRVGEIIQYHLAGTLEEYVRQAPMKLILDEARLWGSSIGSKYLHLGGGVGGEDTDSLFRFKSGFSKDFYQFKVWKLIVNHEKYDELVNAKSLENSNSNYFPLYRLSE